MNQKEFLERLGHTPRDWYVARPGGEVRRPDHQCPITALEQQPAINWASVSLFLGLNSRLARCIVEASDNAGAAGRSRILRAAILEAVGLPPEN